MSTLNRASEDFRWILTGDIKKSVWRLSLPLIPGIFGLIFMDLLDSFLVLQMTPADLLALSLSVPISNGLFAIAIGFNITVAAIIGRWRGERSTRDLTKELANLLHANFIIVLAISTLCVIAIRYSELLGFRISDNNILSDYLTLRFSNFIFFTIIMTAATVFRSWGDTMATGRLLLSWLSCKATASILSVAIFHVDLIELGFIQLFSDSIFAAYSILLLRRMYDFKFATAKNRLVANTKKLAIAAMPAVSVNLIAPIALAATAQLFYNHGEAATAAFGIIIRLESILLIAPMIFTASIPTLIGHNYFASNKERCQGILRHALFTVIWIQLLIAGLVYSYSDSIFNLLGLQTEATTILICFFKIVPFSYTGLGAILIVVSALNAMQNAKIALIFTLVRTVIIYLPIVVVGNQLAGIEGIFFGFFISNILAASLAWHMLNRHWATETVSVNIVTKKKDTTKTNVSRPIEKSRDSLLTGGLSNF